MKTVAKTLKPHNFTGHNNTTRDLLLFLVVSLLGFGG